MEYKAKTRYQDKNIAEAYDAARFDRLKGRLVGHREISLIKKGIAHFGLPAPLDILDLPCGTGRLTVSLAAAGHQVTGVDISAMMIGQAKKKLDQEHPLPIKFFVGDAETLDFPDGLFDLAVCLRLFGHLPPGNRRRVLKELTRVSKKGVVVAYYQRFTLQNLLRARQRSQAETGWYPTTLRQITDEMNGADLVPMGRSYLLPFVSETLVVSARKA